jgi:hypothetical protein
MATYREVVIQGSASAVEAFLAGFKQGKGWASEFYFVCDHHGIKAESTGHRILEALKLEKEMTHVLVTEPRTPAVVEAIKGAKQTGLKILSNKPVKKAEFGYKYFAANKRLGSLIKRRFNEMPADLKRVDAKEKEVYHPRSKGAEGYAPEHDFELKGSGAIEGPLDQVMAFRGVIAKIEPVQVTLISLNPKKK